MEATLPESELDIQVSPRYVSRLGFVVLRPTIEAERRVAESAEMPPMELEPYLHFGGACEEALTFYKEVFAGEVVALMRFREMEGMEIPPGYEDKVMHSNFKSPDLKFMASDQLPGTGERPGTHVSLSLSTRDVTEGERVFAMLSADGTITMPMADTFWGARFGTLTDKFGIGWMVNAQKG